MIAHCLAGSVRVVNSGFFFTVHVALSARVVSVNIRINSFERPQRTGQCAHRLCLLGGKARFRAVLTSDDRI